MLKAGVISHNKSDWCAIPVFAKKTDGPENYVLTLGN